MHSVLNDVFYIAFTLRAKNPNQTANSTECIKSGQSEYRHSETDPAVQQEFGGWIGHILRRNCPLKHVIEGKIEGKIKGEM